MSGCMLYQRKDLHRYSDRYHLPHILHKKHWHYIHCHMPDSQRIRRLRQRIQYIRLQRLTRILNSLHCCRYLHTGYIAQPVRCCMSRIHCWMKYCRRSRCCYSWKDSQSLVPYTLPDIQALHRFLRYIRRCISHRHLYTVRDSFQ